MDTNKLLRSNNIPINKDVAIRAVELALIGKTETEIISIIKQEFSTPFKLKYRKKPNLYSIFGRNLIDNNTIEQMEAVMRIPVATRGALMPDGHVGYGMPIGGVVALYKAISPAFVGYDIACRMMLTVVNMSVDEVKANKNLLLQDIQSVTGFGLGVEFKRRQSHPVMHNPLWSKLSILRNNRDLAARQLGTSGSGNHFADLVTGSVMQNTHLFPIKYGSTFVGLLTHSGSRGVGQKVARHYMKIAEQETAKIAINIPKGYGWLSLNSAIGQEYFQAMNLMGEYAHANHQIIHERFCEKSGFKIVARVENHHNFAWVEGDEVIHRKGATPANVGILGLIPGSSQSASYLVEGLGNELALNSCSHGAGRRFSRKVAKQQFNQDKYNQKNKEQNILHAGVAHDETVTAYKDIYTIIKAQEGRLVRCIAKMRPRIVVMGNRQ